MANTTEMLRLMRHAAWRLAEEEQSVRKAFMAQYDGARGAVNRERERRAVEGLASFTAASSLAQSVLRMVAAAMDEEPVTVATDEFVPLTADTEDERR